MTNPFGCILAETGGQYASAGYAARARLIPIRGKFDPNGRSFSHSSLSCFAVPETPP